MAQVESSISRHKTSRPRAHQKGVAHVLPAKGRLTYASFMKGNSYPGKTFTFLSLFSGAGIGDYGLVLAGGQCVGACELDAHRRAVHKHNIGSPMWIDIKIEVDEIKKIFKKNIMCGH